jgi:hypothetical protein
LLELAAKHKLRVIYVQIAEAHASDEWDIGAEFGLPSIKQTHTLAARTAAAQDMKDKYLGSHEVQVWLDDPRTNAFERAFQCWPTSWYVMQAGRVLYTAQERSGMFDPQDLDTFLLS